MSEFLGAVPEELDAFAGGLDAHAEQLRQLAHRVAGQLRATTWHGSDLDTFAHQWSATLSPQLFGAAQLLADAAGGVRGQATQQRVASEAVGFGGTGAAPVGSSPVGPLSSKQPGFWGGIFDTAWGGWKVVSDVSRAATLYKAITTAEEQHWTKFMWGNSELPKFLASSLERMGVSSGVLDKLGVVKGIAGVAALPLVAFSGFKDVVTGGGDAGWHGALTRVMGGIGGVGATTLLVGEFGGSSLAYLMGASFLLPEVVVPLAAAAVVAYGAYQAANFIYDHREAIGHAASVAWNTTKDLAGSAVNGVKDAAGATVDAVKSGWQTITHPGSIFGSVFG